MFPAKRKVVREGESRTNGVGGGFVSFSWRRKKTGLLRLGRGEDERWSRDAVWFERLRGRVFVQRCTVTFHRTSA
ncbi:hypothetical protein SAMN05443245_1938 [Paraburkholderia fungorum]|uniref:Uncharacterized protein n=1 Tax=Paraburkholderia fungorum TaxID=134537 RepID=A0A1H1C2F6_9BURK|nr:hypothetical protein SAMN05443245_1938 [Paraburkholderia fungorum]